MQKRVCLRSGYKHQFEGRNWRTSKNDSWEVVMAKTTCGKKVGERRIDGDPVIVVKAGGKYYAADRRAVHRPSYLSGARRRK